MKKLSIIVFVALLAAGLGALPASAQSGLPPLCTGVQLQNTDAANAVATSIDFYKQGENDGTANYSFSVSPDLPANGSRSFYIPNVLPSSLPDGLYSAVVNSSGPLNALVNEVTCANSGAMVGASHHGLSSADIGSPVYLPFILSRAYAQGWSSVIAIQNAGPNAVTNLQIQFVKPGSASPVETFTNTTLKAGETWYLDLSSGQYASANLQGFSGAAKVTSNQPVAVAVNYAPSNGSRLLSYNGTTKLASVLYAPQVTKKAFSQVYTSGLTIYNPNGSETPIRIDFIASGSTAPVYQPTYNIPANNALILNLGSLPDANLPSNFNGTAVVRVTGGTNQVVGIANLDSNIGQSDAMNMVPDTDAATTLYMPQIVRNYSNYESGWQVVNTSSNNLGLTIEYWKVNSDGTSTKSFTDSKPLPANSALTNYVGSSAFSVLGNGWNGGVIIKVTSGTGKIVGQGNFSGQMAGDGLLIYNAFR